MTSTDISDVASLDISVFEVLIYRRSRPARSGRLRARLFAVRGQGILPGLPASPARYGYVVLVIDPVQTSETHAMRHGPSGYGMFDRYALTVSLQGVRNGRYDHGLASGW